MDGNKRRLQSCNTCENLLLRAFLKCTGVCIYSYSGYRNITFFGFIIQYIFLRVAAGITTTISSSRPLVDVHGPRRGSRHGQLDRWDHGVCAEREICPGHHGSAHWHLVHPRRVVCLRAHFRSVELSLERIAAADKYRVTTWCVSLKIKSTRI